jgi:hypothetical protein
MGGGSGGTVRPGSVGGGGASRDRRARRRRPTTAGSAAKVKGPVGTPASAALRSPAVPLQIIGRRRYAPVPPLLSKGLGGPEHEGSVKITAKVG